LRKSRNSVAETARLSQVSLEEATNPERDPRFSACFLPMIVTRLDPPCPADSPALIRLFTEPAVRDYLGGPLSFPDAERRVAGILADRSGQVQVIRPESGAAIGLIWLALHHGGPDFEISVVLLPEWEGGGHAYRAARQILSRAFDELALPRVVAETQAANSRCIALLKRLGMKREQSLQRFGATQLLFAIHRQGPR
jgi:ribosomal-protein-alanine N-acetyltransferase